MTIQSQENDLNDLLYCKAKLMNQNKVDCFIFASHESDTYKRKYKSYDDAIKAVRMQIWKLRRKTSK